MNVSRGPSSQSIPIRKQLIQYILTETFNKINVFDTKHLILRHSQTTQKYYQRPQPVDLLTQCMCVSACVFLGKVYAAVVLYNQDHS